PPSVDTTPEDRAEDPRAHEPTRSLQEEAAMRDETTSIRHRPVGTIGVLIAAVIMVLGVVASPAAAAPSMSIPAYKITSNLPPAPPALGFPFTPATVPDDGPSTFTAGANPSAGSYETFAY